MAPSGWSARPAPNSPLAARPRPSTSLPRISRACSSARPVRGARVLALDPGYRTGCKVAVMDETGKLLDHGVVYPTKPRH
ncbi:MAG: hypothetical protein V8Q95_04870, partial [Collinsella sp.]